MAEEKKSIFRKEVLDRISSPEQLSDYLRVTTPGLWVIIVAIVALLVGFFVWMSVDTIETTVPAGVSTQNHSAEVAVISGDAQIATDMTLRVGGQETTILSTKTDDLGRIVGTAEVDLPDGMYEGLVVTESIHPIQFLISSK
jgi:hypothetical protein